MNYLLIAGHLAADPESRFIPSGQKVTTVRVAVNNRRGKNEETLWWRVTFWGDGNDKILSYMKKGSGVMVSGEMSKPEIYTDKSGQPQTSLNMTGHNISFSPFGRSNGQQGEGNQQEKPQQASGADAFGGMGNADYGQVMQGQGSAQPGAAFSDDEIPF